MEPVFLEPGVEQGFWSETSHRLKVPPETPSSQDLGSRPEGCWSGQRAGGEIDGPTLGAAPPGLTEPPDSHPPRDGGSYPRFAGGAGLLNKEVGCGQKGARV